MCDARDETVFHILCECSKLAQREYKYRHDNLARIVHWELCKLYGLNRENNWYDHTPEKSQNNDNVTILWDFNIQTDHVITHRRPDIVVINSSENTCLIIDIAVPADHRILLKEKEKIEKYQDLRREMGKIWNVKTRIIPVVVGALGAISNKLEGYLKDMNLPNRLESLQKAALLGSARILRRVLEI
ncbi:uncharacterized protein LOC144431372 [Styela clava]